MSSSCVDGLRHLARNMISAKAIPAAKHLHRSSQSLPAVVMNQLAFGAGLKLREFGSPKWSGKSLILTRVEPELGSMSGNFYGVVESDSKFSKEHRIQPVDVYGGKWRISQRVYDPFCDEQEAAFRAQIPRADAFVE